MSAKKRRFFRRSKPSVGNNTENIREKTAVKKVIEVIEERRPKAEHVGHQESHPKKQQTSEFPNISQVIAELQSRLVLIRKGFVSDLSKLKGEQLVFAGLFSVLLLVILWQIISIGVSTQHYLATLNTRVKLQKEMTFWEDIATKYPTYRDANFTVALIAYQLGNKQKEEIYVRKTLAIDPNYIYAQNLAKLAQ